jgi:hypothetical protein
MLFTRICLSIIPFTFVINSDHGADDDLKLLNVIESYWKAKMRQSLNLNVQEAIASIVSKSAILPQANKTDEQNILIMHKKSVEEKK